MAQLEKNGVDVEKGPLPEEVVEMIGTTWDAVKEVAP